MDAQTTGTKTSLGHKLIYSAITRFFAGLIAFSIVTAIAQYTFDNLIDLSSLEKDYQDLIRGVVIAILILTFYAYLYKYYEKRRITELSGKQLGRNLGLGIALGFGLQSLTIFVIYLGGSFTIVSVNNILYLIPALTMAITSAITEEILFRGILYRLLEEKLGSYIALAASALIFGMLHMMNPNSSVEAGIAIAIEAGLLLGAVYIYSKNLWLPIALHFAWNFTQSGIYGATTSGIDISKSLFSTNIEGDTLITGGVFGPEASIQALLFCVIATIIIMRLNQREHKIIKPFWSAATFKE